MTCAHISDCQNTQDTSILICNSCQKVDEVHLDEELMEAVCSNIKETGFFISEPQFELKGICQDCRLD